MVGPSELESRGPGAAHTLAGPTGEAARLAGGLPTVARVSPGLFLVPTLSQPALSGKGPLDHVARLLMC